MSTPEHSPTEQEVIAAYFSAQRQHEVYWDEHGIENETDTEPLEMGSYDHFFSAVTRFCKRHLPEGTPDSVFADYLEAICGIHQDKETWDPTLLVCTDMSTEDFLAQALSIKLNVAPNAQRDLVVHGGRTMLQNRFSHFETVARLYESNNADDHEAFWSLVLTQGLPFYNRKVRNSGGDFSYKGVLGPQKFIVELLVETGHGPFTPDEYQAFIERFLIHRIKSDEDRLNPKKFGLFAGLSEPTN